MSDVDGIYNKPPWEDGARLMHTYTSEDRNNIEFGKKSKVTNTCIIHFSPFLLFSYNFFNDLLTVSLNNFFLSVFHDEGSKLKILMHECH